MTGLEAIILIAMLGAMTLILCIIALCQIKVMERIQGENRELKKWKESHETLYFKPVENVDNTLVDDIEDNLRSALDSVVLIQNEIKGGGGKSNER